MAGVFDITSFSISKEHFSSAFIPVRIFGSSLSFLPLRSGDLALDGKGNAVGTWNTKTGGITSNLNTG